MTRFLTVEEALEIIRDQGFHLADPGLFASAIIRPQMSVFGEDAYPDIWEKAAALLESLARNHALADGNKRSALMLVDVFLQLNGWDMLPESDMADFIVSVAVGEIDLRASSIWLAHHSMAV